MRPGRDNSRERWAIHTWNQAKRAIRGHHRRTCVARANQCASRLPYHQLCRHSDRRSRHATDRGGGRVAHRNDIGCLDNLDPELAPPRIGRKRLLKRCRTANQRDRHGEMPRYRHSPVDNRRRRVIAPHRVNSDADHKLRGLLFARRSNLPLPVETTVRTDTMRRLGLVALRAQPRCGRNQCVVRAPLRRARFRVSTFRIRHSLDSRKPGLPDDLR